eukprot:scaffold116465_cov27-Prasinocladus_malaysianus.AAC.1
MGCSSAVLHCVRALWRVAEWHVEHETANVGRFMSMALRGYIPPCVESYGRLGPIIGGADLPASERV